MDAEQSFENQLLERLNAGQTVGEFFAAAISLLDEIVETLMMRVFRKDDYAVKYAIAPLLNHRGPLGQLTVRCKLLYGLGVLSRTDYEDCDLLLHLNEQLAHTPFHYQFTDNTIIGALSALHCASPPLPELTFADDPQLHAMQQHRYQQIVRSSAVLWLTSLLNRINDRQSAWSVL